MDDEELFELCKEVYKRTGWKDTLSAFDAEYFVRQPVFRNSLFSDETPLYDSDYILEKLPRQIERDENSYFYAGLYLAPTVGDMWNAGYRVGASFPDYGCNADTPLKALLKLVIALDDAGELS